MIDSLVRDLTQAHTDQGFLSKSDVRSRLEALVAKAVLEDRRTYRPAAHADEKAELIAALDKLLPLGRSSKGEVIELLKSL